MKKHILLFITILVIIGSIYYLSQPDTIKKESNGDMILLGPVGERISLETGNQLQDFKLIDYSENVFQLSENMSNITIINFWASWCPFCIEEMPLFENIYQKYKDKNIEIIAINRGETKEKAKSFTDELNLSFKLLLNPADDVYKSYQIQAMPTTIFLNSTGVIQYVFFGALTEEKLDELIQFLLESEKAPKDTPPEDEDMPYENKDEKAFPEAETEEVVDMKEKTESKRPIMMTGETKHSVPLEDILSGGPPKDGIPSIDAPTFTTIEEADSFLNDEGIGTAVSFNGTHRFYPNQILVWHEIVNDQIEDQPILVSYCPLCGTSIVFEPLVKGEPTEFGTSGKLWNSNLVMYDRQTNSYWSQVLGEAIVGEMTGTRLKLFPYDNMKWKDWKKLYPDGEVLSKDTGHFRDYTSTPYGGYDNSRDIFFPVDNEDSRYHPKEPTFGVVLNGYEKVYPLSELQKGEVTFSDTIGEIEIEAMFDKSVNTLTLTHKNTGEEIVPFYGFWFSWISVHPNSEVYTAP